MSQRGSGYQNNVLKSLKMGRPSGGRVSGRKSLKSPEVDFSDDEKDDQAAICEGYLEKRGGVNKNWRKRLCRLDSMSGMMYYFDDRHSRKRRLKGEIDLSTVSRIQKSSIKGRVYCFGLNTPNRTYVFSAQYEEERTRWVDAIQQHISKVQKLGDKLSNSSGLSKHASSKLMMDEQQFTRNKMLSSMGGVMKIPSVHFKSENVRFNLRDSKMMSIIQTATKNFSVLDINEFRVQDCDLKTPDNWVERHPALHRLTGAHPVNAEPLTKYFDFSWPTPKEIAFVRNHGPCPKMKAIEYDLSITNAAGEKFVFTLNDLKNMPSEEVMSTCICAGIRRMELNVERMTKGSNYGNGAWHTGIYEGVMLREVFKRCGITAASGKYEWVETEGHEDLPKGKYTTCIPLERVMDYRQDVMLAWLMNGDPLLPDHGFPVRLVAPGIFGGRWTKTIRHIRLLDNESTHFYHLHDNRVLPPYIDAKTPNLDEWFENNLYTYWYHPVNSYIAEPRHGTVCPLAQGGVVPIKGVAYNGNGVMITRVEISLDGGKKWRPCTVTYTSEPRHGCKYWNPVFWEPQVPVTTMELFTLKVDELIVRAFDQSLNTQPVDSTWNLLGFANNCLYRVKLVTRVSRDGPAYQFIHPVSQCGKTDDCTGWISLQRKRQKKRWLPPPKNKKYLPPINLEEVVNHDEEDDAWILIDGVVYDITQYLKDNKHPGGNASLLPFLGLDCSDAFHAVGHSPAAEPDLTACAIGMIGLVGGRNMAFSVSTLPVAGAPAQKPMPYKLTQKEVVNESKTLIRIILLGPEGTGFIADEPIGGHYSIINKNVRRSYTPLGIKKQGDRAAIEYSIKVYEDGELTPWIDKQEVGATIMMAGPKGHIHYAVEKLGYFTIAGQPAKRYKKVTMIAGGTGIAPMLQLLRFVFEHTKNNEERKDLHDLSLIYSVRTADEIMERGELELYRQFANVNFHVTKEKKKRVDKDLITSVCGRGSDDAMALICGPARFCNAMNTYLSQLQYGSIVTY